jgi:hypothetical protein
MNIFVMIDIPLQNITRNTVGSRLLVISVVHSQDSVLMVNVVERLAAPIDVCVIRAIERVNLMFAQVSGLLLELL